MADRRSARKVRVQVEARSRGSGRLGAGERRFVDEM
jgi:hypothetical protein